MNSDTPPSSSLIIDLTGLPEPVILGITLLVRTLKEVHANPRSSSEMGGTPNEPASGTISPPFLSRPRPSAEELEHLLDELSSVSGGKVLPPDFSRADIYDDHD